MRILVTGATGVVGRRAVPLLLAAGHQVTAAGRSEEHLGALQRKGAATVVLDLFSREAIRRAVAGHDAIVNLATHIPFRKNPALALLPGAWKENDRIKKITSSLLVAAAQTNGVKRFVQESFAPIYPDSGDQWITEDVTPHVLRYNQTVLDAEAAAQRFSDGERAGVVLRFGFFYGPFDNFTRLLVNMVAHGWLPLFGRPEGFVSFVNHADAATAVAAALNAPGGIYNVIDDEPLTRRALGDAVSRMLHVPPPKMPPPWMARLAGNMGDAMARSLRISNRKFRATSNWAPMYPSAREGLRAALSSFVKPGVPHGARSRLV